MDWAAGRVRAAAGAPLLLSQPGPHPHQLISSLSAISKPNFSAAASERRHQVAPPHQQYGPPQNSTYIYLARTNITTVDVAPVSDGRSLPGPETRQTI